MRAFVGLIRKEFLQVFRDPNMLRIIFAVPIIQLMVLGYAVNTDVKLIALDIYDYDQSQYSREMVDAMTAGEYFVPTTPDVPLLNQPVYDLDIRFEEGNAEMALVIPSDFSEKIDNGEPATVGLVADGANASQAATGLGYAGQIIRQYSSTLTGQKPPIEVMPKILYNPEMESVYFMVPGIVATLLTMITVMVTSMSVVREKEMGTLEQLLVTPISGSALLAGKMTTFAALGLFEMSVALTVGVLWFGVPFVGSPVLLFVLGGVYLLATLGMGLFFSTITTTQQQAMFYAWFFSIFAFLTSGFLTPISNMPQWVQAITYLNPMRYFVNIVRGIMLRGAGVFDLLPDIGLMTAFGLIIFTIAALRFHKRAA
jgi:ABC-2 type transport system permease protein